MLRILRKVISHPRLRTTTLLNANKKSYLYLQLIYRIFRGFKPEYTAANTDTTNCHIKPSYNSKTCPVASSREINGVQLYLSTLEFMAHDLGTSKFCDSCYRPFLFIISNLKMNSGYVVYCHTYNRRFQRGTYIRLLLPNQGFI
jgi:hypothetical protein